MISSSCRPPLASHQLRLALLVALLSGPAASHAADYAPGFKTPLISDEAIPLQLDTFPERPAPLLELGNNDFFGPGPIPRGHALPTGAVWQPQFVVFGELRSAYQVVDQPSSLGGTTVSEWVNRLDLFGVLYLTPTERFVISVQPLNQTNATGVTRWFGYQDRPKAAENWTTDIDGNIDTFFFEGDFGAIFRNLDLSDTLNTDYHFTIGRQPLVLQDGLLAAGPIDMIGITRASTYWFGSNHTRASVLYGWSNVSRNDNVLDRNASLTGVSLAAEYHKLLIEADALYVYSDDLASGGDGFFAGIGASQQFDVVNTTFRALTSQAQEGDSPAVSTGTLLFSQFSVMQPFTENLIYLNAFWGIDQYASAMRGPANGGPLGQTGILFAAVGMGRYGAALGNQATDSYGMGLGWQIYFDHDKRKQLILETGFRNNTQNNIGDAVAVAARYQQAFGNRLIGVLEGYYTERRLLDGIQGVRTELRVKF